MKHSYFSAVLLSLALLLTGCGGPAAQSSQPTAAPTQAPQEAGLAMTMELGRLYTLQSDGSARLLLDDAVSTYTRRGDILTAVTEDGTVRDIDMRTGESRELFTCGDGVPQQLYRYENGVAYAVFTISESRYGVFDERVGAPRRLEAENDGFFTGLCAAGNMIVAQAYEEDEDLLLGIDPLTLREVWRTPVEEYMSILCWEDRVFAYSSNSFDHPSPRPILTLDPKTGDIAETGLFLPKEAWTLLWTDGETAFAYGGYGEGIEYFLIQRDMTVPLSGDVLPDDWSVYWQDAANGSLLLASSPYMVSEKVDSWYTRESFFRLNTTTGEVERFAPGGAYKQLFSAGDFPVLDSSTARKPVTAQLYTFFCEGPGYEGAVPLCSTTHGAWLNMADKGADIALLAAPTQEERAYLAEKGVEVEMKLYGGDGLVFIGSRECGVENLTLDQLRAIYRGEITNWKELGGVDHPIRVLYRDDQSGSQRLFEQLLWKGQERPDFASLGFECLDMMSTIVLECLYDPYALGYSIMTYLRDVYTHEELVCFALNGIAPAPENVRNGTYPLSTQGYAVIRADESEDSPARRLYDLFGTPLMDEILRMNSITPLHD